VDSVKVQSGVFRVKQAQILLIEDTDAVREVLTRQLEALGVAVRALPDGSRAKEFLSATDFDLVIADLQLPDCSGVDIARFSRARNVPVILLSGESGLTDRPEVAFAGFEDILTKPLSLYQLQNILLRYGLIDKSAAVVASSDYEMDETGVLDVAVIREQMGELDEVALQMISRFPDMMRPLLQKIIKAENSGDVSTLAEAAHSLKGAARSAGAMNLGLFCEQVQDLAQNGTADSDSIKKIEDEFLKVESAIKKLRA
jgi:CheY-like chemotaxis protein/HPt (histidine-containing phosphotransfer) domain-containing protein